MCELRLQRQQKEKKANIPKKADAISPNYLKKKKTFPCVINVTGNFETKYKNKTKTLYYICEMLLSVIGQFLKFEMMKMVMKLHGSISADYSLIV